MRVLIMATGDLARIAKVIKLAQALSGAGYDVVRLGFKTSSDDPDDERDEYGPIIRLDPLPPFPASSAVQPDEKSIGESSAPGKSGLGWAIRGALKSILFTFAAGRRLREYVIHRRSMAVHRSRWGRLGRAGVDASPDLVIASQFSALPAGRMVKRATGARLIYDSRDLWSTYSWEPRLGRVYKELEGRYIREADLVTTVSPRSAEYLAQLYRVPMPTVVYNGSMLRAPEVTPAHAPVKILFQGHFMPDRGLRELVEAMKILRGVAVLTLQGWGKMEPELRELAVVHEVADIVSFAEPVNPTEVVVAASNHDIGIVNFTATTANHRATVPNKLFDYMGGGLALVGVDQPGVRGVIEEAGCGVVMRTPDARGIAEAVRLLAEDSERLFELKQNALRAWERYSWPEQGKIFVREVDRLLGVSRTEGMTEEAVGCPTS